MVDLQQHFPGSAMLRIILIVVGAIVVAVLGLGLWLKCNPKVLTNAFIDVSSGLNANACTYATFTCNEAILNHERKVNEEGLPSLYKSQQPVSVDEYINARTKDTAEYVLSLVPKESKSKTDESTSSSPETTTYAAVPENQPTEVGNSGYTTPESFDLKKYPSLEAVEKLITGHPAAIVDTDGKHWVREDSGACNLIGYNFVDEYKKAYSRYADQAEFKKHQNTNQ